MCGREKIARFESNSPYLANDIGLLVGLVQRTKQYYTTGLGYVTLSEIFASRVVLINNHFRRFSPFARCRSISVRLFPLSYFLETKKTTTTSLNTQSV